MFSERVAIKCLHFFLNFFFVRGHLFFIFLSQCFRLRTMNEENSDVMSSVSHVRRRRKSYHETARFVRHKTSFCWSMHKCTRRTCDFAHSFEELRVRYVPRAYKTIPCRFYPSCNFGANCLMSHGEEKQEWCKTCGIFLLVDPISLAVVGKFKPLEGNHLEARKPRPESFCAIMAIFHGIKKPHFLKAPEDPANFHACLQEENFALPEAQEEKSPQETPGKLLRKVKQEAQQEVKKEVQKAEAQQAELQEAIQEAIQKAPPQERLLLSQAVFVLQEASSEKKASETKASQKKASQKKEKLTNKLPNNTEDPLLPHYRTKPCTKPLSHTATKDTVSHAATPATPHAMLPLYYEPCYPYYAPPFYDAHYYDVHHTHFYNNEEPRETTTN